MPGFLRFCLLGAATITLSGCVASMPPVEVTRFHTAEQQQIVPGSIRFAGSQGEEPETGIEQRTYEAAVRRELQKAGFIDAPADASAADYLVSVRVEPSRISSAGRRSPVSVGVGGGTSSYGSGVGVGIGFNLSGRPKDRIATELSVRMTRSSDEQVVWEGRSEVEAKEGSPGAQPGLAASRLAEALFRDFPGQSGETIRVP